MTMLIRNAALFVLVAALSACANSEAGGNRNLGPDPTANMFIGLNDGFVPQDRG